MVRNISIIRSRRRKTKPFSQRNSLFLAVYGFSVALVFVPLLISRVIGLLMLGALIYFQEKKIGFLVPASPGFIFWFGNFLSYVIGGISTGFLYDGWSDFGIRHLDSALLYLSIGISAYYFGLHFVSTFISTPVQSQVIINNLRIKSMATFLIALLFIAPVFIGNFINDVGILKVYSNLVVGALQSVEPLPIILLAIYVRTPKPKWWASLLLFGSAFAVPFAGIAVGYGRSKMLLSLFSVVVVWLVLKWNSGEQISKRDKMLLGLAIIITLLLFGIWTQYRQRTNYDTNLAANERLLLLQEAGTATYDSDNIFKDSFGP